MRLRLINKIYANIFGYFWYACPICGIYFGGHEWLTNLPMEQSSLLTERNTGTAVCPDCARSNKALEINRKIYSF